MSKSLPYSMKDLHYDNGKFRHRSASKAISQALLTSKVNRNFVKCSTGKFLGLLLIGGLVYLMMTHTSAHYSGSQDIANDSESKEEKNFIVNGTNRLKRLLRRPPKLPPRLSPDEIILSNTSTHENMNSSANSKWLSKQQRVKDSFIHAWSGYKRYAMDYDELMPLSHRGVDGLGGLGATVVDALDTAMIMGLNEIVQEAGSWIETHLPERLNMKGQVNLFETTIRILGGLLSAYHLSGGEEGGNPLYKGPKSNIYLENARNLADRLLTAFTSSPSDVPYSDVILHERSAHPAPDGLSSTAEVASLQLEFNYLSFLTGDPKYSTEAMKVL
ncbi:unnamed protein product [Cuscuta campestris]|uniref:alpha-1,2-Mannosidase n=1 Tax=Cuscuta campestris TaxID=132261 RepID=A0A484N6X3_9ASTE|nr:unnamed protein product [Cuscuta campestris]